MGKDNENLIKVEEFPFYKKVWLLTELARTENPLAIKTKYKRIFGIGLPEAILQETSQVYRQDIIELRKIAKVDLESHKLASAYARMDKYERIEEMCYEGFETGTIDILGNPVIRKDPATALKAVQAGREEQNQVYQNELKLLQILVQERKLNPTTSSSVPCEAEDEVVEAGNVPESDNDKFFIKRVEF